jgi:5'-methylthioadenosine phosphorylase
MIGIIGGTLLMEKDFLEERKELEVSTPFGVAEVDLGCLNGVEVVLIQRHGRKRNRPPAQDKPSSKLLCLQIPRS